MDDPLGLIGRAGGAGPGGLRSIGPMRGVGGAEGAAADGPKFRELLERELERVNELQRDAMQAAEDLATGRRDDLEGAILATQKADAAFRLLLSVRNKVMEAYEEIKQVRV